MHAPIYDAGGSVGRSRALRPSKQIARIPVRNLLRTALIGSTLLLITGCGSNHPIQRVESPVNVTHEVAFGDYRRVYQTTYHILNRYGVIRNASYRYGEITALIREDNSFLDKTRRTIQARIFDAGDYYDVECRVLISVEDSEPATFQGQFHPRYNWKTVGSEPVLETRLNNEIREALSGGAWQAKQPLTKKGHYAPSNMTLPSEKKKSTKAAPKPKKKDASDDADTDEVSLRTLQAKAKKTGKNEAFERLGIIRMRRGSYAGAVKAFKASIDQGQDLRFAHFLLGQAEFSQGDYASALRSIRRGHTTNTEWVGADVDVRALYGPSLKTFPQRMKRLVQAAEKKAHLQALVGYMRYFSKDAPGALTAFDRALAADPDDALAKAYRAAARKKVDAAHGLEDF